MAHAMGTQPQIRSFVAVGDSFTEGMSDLMPDGSYRGWADALAARLGARSPDGFRYANLAVRGKLITQIVDEQLPAAAALGADLVTLVGGLNDALRPGYELTRVCEQLEKAVATLAPSCGTLVLMKTPGRRGPVFDRYRPRMQELFAEIDAIGERHGALVVDLYSARSLADQRMWADDRLHLTAEAHARVAEAVWQRLGLPAESDWEAPMPPSPAARWGSRRAADVRFARAHLFPWIGRRLTGRSSGDGRFGAQMDPATRTAFWVGPGAGGAGPVSGWSRLPDESGPAASRGEPTSAEEV